MTTITLSNTNRPSIALGVTLVPILLFLYVVFLHTPAFLHLFGQSQINTTLFFLSHLLAWLWLILIGWYAVKIEKQDLLLWKEKKQKFITYLLSIVCGIIAIAITIGTTNFLLSLTGANSHSVKIDRMVAMFKTNKLLLVFTALTAGVVEEVIFRGFLLPRLTILLRKPYLAIIASSLIFGLIHFTYGTLSQMIAPFLIGLILAFIYNKYRNIKMVIAIHFLWDLIAMILLVSISK
jgi:membrane protease YdiL (CAAX protease family)